MAAGDIIKGKDLRIKIDGETNYHATECTFSITREIESIATKDTNGSKKISGNYDWTMGTSALVANQAAASTQNDFKILMDAMLADTPVQVEFTTDVVGDVILSGTAVFQSVDMTAAVGSSASFSVTLNGDGDITVDAVPTP